MELNWYEYPIYILKKHVKGTEKMLTSETYPLLPYEHQDLMDELEGMVKNEDKTIADLFTFASGSDLSELMDCGDEKFYLQLDKDKFWEELLSKTYPKRQELTMKFVKMDKSIVAYSDMREGWISKEFQLDDDFKVGFSTNFGYGTKAYFYVLLEYKNIPVLLGPYYPKNSASDLSEYNARYRTEPYLSECCTLKLQPDFIEYKKAMDGIAEIYNAIVKDMEESIQAIVLNKYLSKTISSRYWKYDIYK